MRIKKKKNTITDNVVLRALLSLIPKSLPTSSYKADYPLKPGEEKITEHIILKNDGFEYIVADNSFYGAKDIVTKANVKGNEKSCHVITKIHDVDPFIKMKPFVEKKLTRKFAKKYQFKKVEIYGINSRTTEDFMRWNYVYPDVIQPSNKNGCGLVYSVRFRITWKDGTENLDDTATIFYYRYENEVLCAQNGPVNVLAELSKTKNDLNSVCKAFQQRLDMLQSAKQNQL